MTNRAKNADELGRGNIFLGIPDAYKTHPVVLKRPWFKVVAMNHGVGIADPLRYPIILGVIGCFDDGV